MKASHANSLGRNEHCNAALLPLQASRAAGITAQSMDSAGAVAEA